MKKIGLLCLLFICGLFLFFVVSRNMEKKVDAVEFLPPDVFYYGEQHDFIKMYKEFAAGKLGKAIGSIDYVGITEKLGGDARFAAGLMDSWHEIETVLNDPVVDQIIGRKVSLALFSSDVLDTDSPAELFEERLLFITKPRRNASVMNLLASLFAGDARESSVLYGKHTITRYRLGENRRVSIATVDGVLIGALDERLVRKSLDIYDGNDLTLADNTYYRQLRDYAKGARNFQYISVSGLLEQGKLLAGRLAETDRDNFLAFIDHWDGWEAMGYGAWKDKGIIREKVKVLYDSEKIDSEVVNLFNLKSSDNRSLAMVPASTMLYYWLNSLNISLIWEMYNSTLVAEHPHVFDLLRQELLDGVGLSIEEILAMLDNESALLAAKVDETSTIPIPRSMLIQRLKEPQKFMEVFRKLLDFAEIPVNNVRYEGYDITYWGIRPEVGLQPAVCMVDNYFLVANSSDFLKQVVSLQKEPKKSLLKQKELAPLKENLASKNNSCFYINIVDLAETMKKFADWATVMAVLQGPETSYKVGVVVNEILTPLLDGITMYKKVASRTAVEGNVVFIESVTIVRGKEKAMAKKVQ